jgi:hypothetical protein
LKANLLNLLGAIFFVKEELIFCILVSCKQNTMQELSPILALTTLCLFSSFNSLIFQKKTKKVSGAPLFINQVPNIPIKDVPVSCLVSLYIHLDKCCGF